MRSILVGDVMTRNFVSIKPNKSLYDCAKLMEKEDVNSLVVSEGIRLLGILTSRDILRTITKKPLVDLKRITAIDIAIRRVAVIKPSADISEAIIKMRALNFRRLPVVTEGKLIGVITLKDILSAEPGLYEDIRPLMEIREEEQKNRQLSSNWSVEGICDNCGALTDLSAVDGLLICSDCRDEVD
ncbi:MAG: CBS domain-containing protein [Nanoarchaeota archaeon]|nr:CBS domain-containing protein [Nanoarchaeota archaeon]